MVRTPQKTPNKNSISIRFKDGEDKFFCRRDRLDLLGLPRLSFVARFRDGGLPRLVTFFRFGFWVDDFLLAGESFDERVDFRLLTCFDDEPLPFVFLEFEGEDLLRGRRDDLFSSSLTGNPLL